MKVFNLLNYEYYKTVPDFDFKKHSIFKPKAGQYG